MIVQTDALIRHIFRKLDLAGRMVAWAIKLSEFGIMYKQRKAIKAQALADFVVKMKKMEEEQPA